jgi:betaine-aldehyde dehydrogenase
MSRSTVTRGTLQIPLPEPALFIGGRWQAAEDETTFSVLDPATEEHIVDVSSASEADVDRAVAAARAALENGEWARMAGAERGRVLWRVADLIERDVQHLAALEALEIAKPIGDPLNIDVPMAAETFRHFAGWADRITGQAIPVPDFMGRARHCYTRREPVGVVAAITPWNAPVMIASWKIAPALACGCTLVIKPPADAPLSTLHLTSLLAEAGVPAGVVNVVTGPGSSTGASLVRHAGVDKVSFTGSPEVGREIAQVASAAFKPVTLELGGKSPQLIFADADLENAVPTAAISVFANAGEVCAAGSRIFVERAIRDEVVEGLEACARGIVVGDPFAEETTMGALINQAQLDRVLGYVRSGHDEGAQLVSGGRRLDRAGYFIEPTIFAGTNDMTIARDEIFGPVATVIPFDDPEEAVSLANDTRYGLTAVVWTQNVTRAHAVAARIRAGAVWVNAWGAPDPRLPWGGMKTSGVGRELGEAAIRAHTEEKVVNVVL